MDLSSLTTGSGNGSVSSTQSPQTAGQTNTGGTDINSVQPNIPSKDLVGSGGISLNSTALSTVSLNSAPSTSTITSSSPKQTVAHHKANTLVLGGLVLVLIVAVVSFMWIKNSANNTT